MSSGQENFQPNTELGEHAQCEVDSVQDETYCERELERHSDILPSSQVALRGVRGPENALIPRLESLGHVVRHQNDRHESLYDIVYLILSHNQ